MARKSREEGEIGAKSWEEGESKMLGVGSSGEISMRRQFFFCGGTGNLAYTVIPFGLLGLLGFLG